MSQHVLEVDDRSFEREVIERSKLVPVVVDFWAPWCGPCLALGPVLERLAEQYAGQFVLAKVNIDENPALAQSFGIQSIPMVMGFRDGQTADQFLGALPESGVRDFLQRLLPSEAEHIVQAAAQRLDAGDTEGAEKELRRALALDPRSDRARLMLAEILADRLPVDDALALLERVGPGPLRAPADRLAAQLRIRAAGGGDETKLRAQIEATPADLEARFELAQLLAASARYDEALAEHLEIVRRQRGFRDDAARKAMLDIFDLLGPGNELVDRYRSELARVLFS